MHHTHKHFILCLLFFFGTHVFSQIDESIKIIDFDFLRKEIKTHKVNIVFFEPDNCANCFSNESFLNRYCNSKQIKRIFILKNSNTSNFIKHLISNFEPILKGNFLLNDSSIDFNTNYIGNEYMLVEKDTVRYSEACEMFEESDTQFFTTLFKNKTNFNENYNVKSLASKMPQIENELWSLLDSSIPQSYLNVVSYIKYRNKVFLFKKDDNSFLKIYNLKEHMHSKLILPSELNSPTVINHIYNSIYQKDNNSKDSALKYRTEYLKFGFQEINIDNIFFERKYFYVFTNFKPLIFKNDSQIWTPNRLLVLKLNYNYEVTNFWFESLSDFSNNNIFPRANNFNYSSKNKLKNKIILRNISEESINTPNYVGVTLDNKRHLILNKKETKFINLEDSLRFNYNPYFTTHCFVYKSNSYSVFNLDYVPVIFKSGSNGLKYTNIANDFFRNNNKGSDNITVSIMNSNFKNNQITLLAKSGDDVKIMKYSIRTLKLISKVDLPNIKDYIPSLINNGNVIYISKMETEIFGIKCVNILNRKKK